MKKFLETRKRIQVAGMVAILAMSTVVAPEGNLAGTVDTAKAASKKAKSLSLAVKKATLTVGDKLTLKAAVKPKNVKIKWSSSKKSVASVSKKGIVKAKKAGSAKVTAKAGKKKVTCKVIVKSVSKSTATKAPESPSATAAVNTTNGVLIDEKSPDWVGAMEAAKNAKKLAVVAGFSDTATCAWFSYHEKANDGTWHVRLTTPAFIGKNGLGKTKEGDSMTPVGEFKFNRAFGIADDPGCAIPYTKVTADHYWSGDPNYHYNELVNIKDYPGLAMDDSEHIIDYTYNYQYCLNISYNAEGTPGLGSAIFLHCFGAAKPFSGGCIAIPESHMKQFMQIVDKDTVIVIDSAKNLFNDAWPSSIWPANPGV